MSKIAKERKCYQRIGKQSRTCKHKTFVNIDEMGNGRVKLLKDMMKTNNYESNWSYDIDQGRWRRAKNERENNIQPIEKFQIEEGKGVLDLNG